MSFNSILLWCVGGAGLDAQSSTQPQHQHAATKHKRNSLVSLFVYKWRTQLEWEWLTYSKHGHTNEAPWAMVQLSHLCPAPPWPHSGRLLTCSVFTPLHLACELFSFHFNVFLIWQHRTHFLYWWFPHCVHQATSFFLSQPPKQEFRFNTAWKFGY